MLRKTILISIFLCYATFAGSQDTNNLFKDISEVYLTFHVNSGTDLQSISRMISIDNVTPEMQVYAYANKKGFSEFLDEGIDFKVLQHPGTLHQPRMLDEVNIKNIDDWDFYPTYDAYVDMMYQFEADFPDICDVFSIGTTNEGREIIIARITDNIGQSESEPEFFYTSTMHGDETAGYVLMLRLIDYLLNAYGTNARLTNLVDEIDIYINPLANPDGTYHGGNNTIYGAIRFNAMGVDLNRNFPDPEDGPHPDGNPWQTETIHFMNFAEERNLVMGANIHSGAEVCNYPWDTWATLAADDDWWVYVCREYADTVHANAPGGYMTQFNNGITNGYQWYTIAGGRQDYMNYFHQMREFTLEISDVKLLPAGQLPAHWNYNYKSLLNYLEQCLFGVRGKITDSATGEAIKAEAYVLSHESDSSWVYSSLPEGNYHRLLFESIYSIRYSKPGYYTQTYDNVVVNEREATVLDVELVNAFSGVNEHKAETFRIYPNPVTGNYIKLKAEQPIEELSIYSMNGELCYKTDANGANSVFVDVSMLDAGTYIISIELGDRSLQQKMIRH